MKKFIMTALAASVLATPVLAQPYGDHHDRGRFEQARHGHDRQIQHRNWRKGERFDYRYAPNYRVISSPRAYHLREAPRGYRWVRSGNDAVLTGVTTGIVASVLANIIR